MKPKARVLASSAIIKVKDPNTGLDIKIGEIDSFRASSTSTIIKSRPIGTALETIQHKYGGYDLEFQGGKVDWNLASLLHGQDILARSIGEAPMFTVESTIKHFDGTVETYLYNRVIIHGYSVDINTGDAIGESFKGYAPERNSFNLGQVGDVQQQLVYSIVNNYINEMTNLIGDQINLF